MSRHRLVGGTFTADGGKPSYIVQKMGEYLGYSTMNGGKIDDLMSFDFNSADVLIWMPHVDNAEEKILPTIKEINQKMLLISSKRVVEKEYKESDVIGRLLKTKSNLGLMITKEDDYRFRLLDPLGNQWVDTKSIQFLCEAIKKRVDELLSFTRVRSTKIGPAREFRVDQDFLSIVRGYGNEFSKHVNAINPNRFLGNAASRCSFGFPSVKIDDRILVTRRNVDKTTLSENDFVEIEYKENEVGYYGDVKPSVDSPIQLLLFNRFPNIEYMIHGHVYIENAPMTDRQLPCGCIEEVDEICKLASADNNQAFNLNGHGFLIMSDDIDFLRSMKNWIIPRPFPETHK